MMRIRTKRCSWARVPARLLAGVLAALMASPPALGAEPVDGVRADGAADPRPLLLSMGANAPADDAAASAATAAPAGGDAVRGSAFGSAGQRWWSLSFGVAPSSQTDTLVQVGYHEFLADDFELGVFLGGWYHDQDDNAAASASLSVQFRYHFINHETWSMYGLVGAGIMGSTHNVPDGGTGFNFLPTVGLGGTMKLGDGPTRLDVGVRWHHISNANINGSGRNPDRDAAMIYVGVMFPF